MTATEHALALALTTIAFVAPWLMAGIALAA